MTAPELATEGGLDVVGTDSPPLGLLYIGRSGGSKSKRRNKEAGQGLGVRTRKEQ